MTSADERLDPARGPRLNIQFPLAAGSPATRGQLPFVVAVLADLSADGGSGRQGSLAPCSPIEVDHDSFGDVMRELAPQLRLVGPALPDGGVAELRFAGIEDFAPHRVAEQLPSLRPALRLRRALSRLRSVLGEEPGLRDAVAEALHDVTRRSAVLRAADGLGGAEGVSFLHDLVARARFGQDSAAQEDVLPAVRQLFVTSQAAGQDPLAELERLIRTLDAGLTEAMTPIVHHPRFVALEATWRGLWFLVLHSTTGVARRVCVIDATRDQVTADLTAGSALFTRFCTLPFELDGEGRRPAEYPASVLVVDWSFGADPEEVRCLVALARLAADCHAVALTNAAASLVGLEVWEDLRADTEIRVVASGQAGDAWRELRALFPGSQYLGVLMPPVAAREAYGPAEPKAAGFAFEEEDGATPPMNPAWVFAARLMHEDARSGWFTRVRSLRPDGWSPGLARARGQGANPYSRMTDRQELAASRAGLITLSVSASGESFFPSVGMVHEPRQYDRPDASQNAAIAARLPFVLGTGRFMQSLRVLASEFIRSMDDEALAGCLRGWLAEYVYDQSVITGRDRSSAQERFIPKPLHSINLQLRALPDGRTAAVCHMRPWLDVEELSTEIRLIARMPRRPAGVRPAIPHPD
ncbi:type VI secretion system contractile sheath domain-containing protein [Roseomonas sp. CCTCC AB2023176]|uniref:type VI secretion system contractile sheath domain-containing protein n=1 Tax=Roseomonas sp. CCTCC AB2023176 TaxID=3342640 RepID=UPI0035D89D5D